ncbi:MAG TPA: zf-HC2 domain-containing protein [Candidatus Baltobacteraceae bacterium]
MRCSSCEPLLDRYVEGTLSAPQMVGVSTHVRGCESCRALLEELKAVDGLLETTRVLELPENFTFALMAEVRTLPAPRARQHPLWSFLVLYSAAAWVAAVVAMILTGTGPGTVLAAVSSALSRGGVASSAFSSGLSHSLAHIVPTLAAFGTGVLTIDLAVASAFALLYFVIRPRVAARLVAVSESLS